MTTTTAILKKKGQTWAYGRSWRGRGLRGVCFGIFLNAEKTCPCLSSCEAKIAFKPLEIETPFLLEDFLFLYSQNQFTQGLEMIK